MNYFSCELGAVINHLSPPGGLRVRSAEGSGLRDVTAVLFRGVAGFKGQDMKRIVSCL